jgi:hypothetical protein
MNASVGSSRRQLAGWRPEWAIILVAETAAE